MLSVSAEWKRSVFFDDNRNYLGFVEIITQDGEQISLDNSKLWQNGFVVTDSTSEENRFTLGSLTSTKLTIKINNIYDEYNEFDFEKSKVIAYIGKQLESGVERVKIGTFKVNEASYDGSVITLVCLDNINNFNKIYDSILDYPASVSEIIQDACANCDIPLLSTRFDNSNYIVKLRPDSKYTYGQVVAYCLQICGLYGICDSDGNLKLNWYNLDLLSRDNINGGTFSTQTTPYSDGDTVDGGNFTDYSSGDTVDGGNFTELEESTNLYFQKQLNLATDDVVITGIKIFITSSDSEEENIELLFGNNGYVISIKDNPLILNETDAQTIGNFLHTKIVGMKFRPMSGEFLSDPTIESGDIVFVIDRRGKTYNCFVSNRRFSLNGSTSLSCDAESPLRNSSAKFSAETKTIIEAKKNAKKQIDTYNQKVQLMTQLMSESFGLFKTEEVQEDGSVIYIMHNKKDIASSQIRWKMSANGMVVSNDYGKTWVAGIDKNGNALFNVMSAIGINFDWAKGGTITLGGENNVSGKQYVKDAQGKTLCTLDEKGITLADETEIKWENGSGLSSTSGIIGGWNIEKSSLTTTIKAYLPPTYTELKKIKDYTEGKASLDNLELYDFDQNGVVNFKDMIICNYLIEGELTPSDYKNIQKTDITIVINSQSVNRTITIKGTNTWGTYIETFIGINGFDTERINTRFLKSEGFSFKVPSYAPSEIWWGYELDSSGILSFYTESISGNPLLRVSNANLEIYNGNFSCAGTKSRIAKTKNYSDRLLYCYEMTSPIFGDIGEGIIDETGKCCVFIDDIFAETVDLDCHYQVFLQKYGDGDCWVSERNPMHFVVEGTKNLKFGWEIKAVQKQYDTLRLDTIDSTKMIESEENNND